MKSSIRRAMRAARERDYIAWEPDDPEPWAMPGPSDDDDEGGIDVTAEADTQPTTRKENNADRIHR